MRKAVEYFEVLSRSRWLNVVVEMKVRGEKSSQSVISV
jgi:hypothetical protein